MKRLPIAATFFFFALLPACAGSNGQSGLEAARFDKTGSAPMAHDANVEAMTVNERLGHFGLFEAFDAAVRSRELSQVTQVLVRAQFAEGHARQIAESVLSSPERYGF